MKLLVTGGAGFIGSNFICYWHKNHPKDKIINLDKLTYAGDPENLRELKRSSRYELIKGDVCDKNIAKKFIKDKIDLVIHFAAESHVTRSETDKDRFWKTNLIGTQNLLEAAKIANIKRFIHISTDEVYGSTKNGYFKENDKKIGDKRATSEYAKSKSQADDLAMRFGKSMPIIVVRPTNNFGPKQYPEKALPRWITNLLLGDKIPVWGKGEQVRDWLYVEDNCKAIELLINKGEPGEAYNVGANNDPEIPNIQVAKWLLEILDKDNSMIKFVPDPRQHHDFRYGIDTSKIKKLGWKPSPKIKEKFKDTVDWYKVNEKWWKKHKFEAEEIYKKPKPQ